MTSAADITAVGLSLLDPLAPALTRYHDLEAGGGTRVFLAARHDVVREVLCDELTFSLRHYDELLQQIAGPVRYLVGENDGNRQLRMRQLLAAQAHVDEERGAAAQDGPPNLAPGYRAWIAAMARAEAGGILDVLETRRRTGETINFVREYAFLLAYRMARRIVGVPAPRKPGWFVRAVVLVRNLISPGPWVRLKGELGTATTALTLQLPLFGHVFGTVTTSPGWIQAICRPTVRTLLDAFDEAWDMPQIGEPTSLLAGMRAVEPQFGGAAGYETQARSVLFELTGALVMIVAKVMAEIAGLAASPAGAAAGIDWDGLIARLGNPALTAAEHDATINEMLRLVDGSRLVRTVRHDCHWRGTDLHAGDRVLVLTNCASRDPAAFPEPGRFRPDPARPYITSGPLQGPHVCYGRMMAWTILREGLLATAGRIVPVPGARLTTFGGLPDDLRFAPAP
ncbi:MAG: cytochrome P450 [Novosphingobium sp.]